MLGRSRHTGYEQLEQQSDEPLLDVNDRDHTEHDSDVLFSVGDDETDDTSLLETEERPVPTRQGRSVHFEDDVQVIALPLRSTFESREAAYELDTDDLEGVPVEQLEVAEPRRNVREQTVPLLVGLLDSATARGSLEDSLGLDISDAELDALAEKRLAGGGMLDSVANMANSILGAGIIGLPYAVRQAGFFTGIILLVVLCAVTDWTIRLIVINAKLSGRNSYIDIMDHCFGPSGRAAVSFFQFAFAFGGMCAFGIIIGDTIPHVIRSLFPSLHNIPVLSLLTQRQFVIALCTIAVSYPLSLHRNIEKLARASLLALIGMLIIVGSVLFEGPRVEPELKGDPRVRFTVLGPGLVQAIGVISFAFVCHHNSLLIYGSLRTPTLDRFTRVTHISTVLSLVACCTLAISAYVVFTDKTQGNILNNFSADDTVINVARFCFGLNMFTTLPLELFVCREVIEQYFFSHEAFNMQRHVFFTTVILCSSMLIALITCDLGVMLEITGGASATALAYIFPAACYVRLAGPGEPWHARSKLPAIVCALFGTVVMCFSLFQALAKAWTPAGEPRICR